MVQRFQIWIALILTNLLLCKYKAGQDFVFSPLDKRFELQEEQIRYLSQLPDRRLIVFTESTVNMFTGGGFKTINIDEKSIIKVDQNSSYIHRGYFADGKIWVKSQNRLTVINVITERSEEAPLEYLKSLELPEPPANFFGDSYEGIWLLTKVNKMYHYDNAKKKVNVFSESVLDNSLVKDSIRHLRQAPKRWRSV